MRKIALQMYMSLDGVMEAPERFTPDYWDDDHEQYAYDRSVAADALLLGRSTYETFAASWPLRSGDHFTDRMNSYPKYIVSKTLKDPEWNNSQVVTGDVVTVVETRVEPDDLVAGFHEERHEPNAHVAAVSGHQYLHTDPSRTGILSLTL